MEFQTKINPDVDTEIIYVESWKGKDEISIYEGPKHYKIIEHRKSKENGEINESIHIIESNDVRFLWGLIRNLEMGDKYGYKYLVRKLIIAKEIHKKENTTVEIMMEAFNGGTNRAKYYFPLLYYPLKVLEAKGYVQYYGRGGIAKLMDGEFR